MSKVQRKKNKKLTSFLRKDDLGIRNRVHVQVAGSDNSMTPLDHLVLVVLRALFPEKKDPLFHDGGQSLGAPRLDEEGSVGLDDSEVYRAMVT